MMSRKESIALIEDKALEMRLKALDMGLEAGVHGGHFGSAYSMA